MILDETGNEVSLESLNLQPIPDSSTTNQPSAKALAVQQLANSFLGNAEETGREVDAMNQAVSVSPDEWTTPRDNAWRDTDSQAQTVQRLTDEGYGTNLNTNLFEINSENNYQSLKQATHDLAHFDSAEQGVVDWVKSKVHSWEDNELVGKSEAEQLAKEEGVDLKFENDKPITRGALNYAINRQKQKKELEKQVAYYRSTGDYSALQEILLLGSAISGGIGFIETAATVGLSVAAGEGIAYGLGRLASVTKNATGILKGVQGAQRAAYAARYAQVNANIAQEAKLAGDIAKYEKALGKMKYWQDRTQIRKGATFAEKFGYDAYQFGKFGGERGIAASLPSTSAAFAIDGAAGSVLPEMARLAGDNATMSGEYSSKDMVAGIAAGGAIGATMPVFGRVFKTGGKQVMEVFQEKAMEKARTVALEGAVTANKAKIEAAEKSGKTVEEMLNDIHEAVADAGPLEQAELAHASAIHQQNVTDEEFDLALSLIIGDLKAGRIPNIDKLPIRNLYYSNIPDILNAITDHAIAGKPVKDLLETFEKMGLKIESKGTGNWHNPMEELRVGLYTAKLGTTARIAGETKALGRLSAYGLNQRDANKTLANIYLARMGGDTEAAIQAGMDVENYVEHLVRVRKQIRNIVDTYNMIEHANDAARAAKQAPPYDYKYQLTAYRTMDDPLMGEIAQDTDLPGMLKQLAHMLLPEDIRKNYKQMLDFVDTANLKNLMTGKPEVDALRQEQLHKATDFLMKVEQWEDDVYRAFCEPKTADNGKYTFHRLRVIGEESGKSQTAFFERFDKEIEQGIDDINHLYNTDRIFAEENNSPEEILRRIQDTNEVSELSYVYNPENLSARQMKDLISDSARTQGQLETAKLNLQSYQDSDIIKSIKELTASQERSMSSRLQMGHFFGLEQDITAAEAILNDGAAAIRDAFAKKLKENKYIQKIMEVEGTLDGNTLLRVTSEEGGSLADMFKEAVAETLGDSFPVGSLGNEYDDIFLDAIDTFTDYLRKHPEDALTTIATPHGFNAETNTAEEIAKSLSESYKQTNVLDGLLTEMMTRVSDDVARFEVRKITELTNFYDAWGRCLQTPGKMSESILGEVTMTWLARKGSSLSIENMSSINTEYKWFLQALDKKEVDAGERLSEYALNPDNFNEIRDAIVDTWMYTAGKMTEEEVEAFTRTVANTRAGRTAQAFLDAHAGIVQHLNELGSNKSDITRLLNPSKLSRSHAILSTNELSGDFFSHIGGWIQATKNEALQETLSRFCVDDAQTPVSGIKKFLHIVDNKKQMRTANNAVYLFHNLDLDKHFGRGLPTRVGLNELRDAIADGTPLEVLVRKYGEKDINKALTKIADGILGSSKDVGLMRRLWTGSHNTLLELASEQSKYINDMAQPLHFKSTEALKAAIKDFGYDDMQGWFEASVGNGKRAYAVLRKAGTNPMQFYNGLMDLAHTYAAKVAPLKYGDEAATGLQQSLSTTWENRVRFAVNQVCGTTSAPMTAGMVVAQSIIRMLSTPMLMKAGFKSLTDYAYQYQYLVTTGLRSSIDVTARYDVYSKFIKSFARDKKLLNSIYMSQQLRENVLYEMVYNEPISSGMLHKKGGLNEWAPAWMKFEQMSKDYSKVLLDKMAFIGPLTKYNRMNAALNVMEAVGDFASNSYADIAKINDGRLLQTLNRFGITQVEWDDILSKKAVCSMNDYVAKFHTGETLGELGDSKLFFPELLIDLTDDELKAAMEKQGIAITAENISNYKQSLVDKASMIVNVSADEMTTIPTARVQGALSLAQDPNTWLGMGIRALTQFQSFGTGVNFYHWGRRLASQMDMNDPLFNKMLCCTAGFGSTAKEMAGFVAELALFQFILNEVVSGMAGTRKAMTVDGEVNAGNITEKVTKAVVDQAGIMGPLLDAIVTGFERGRGAGGGFALSVLPAGSTLLGQASRVAQAATKESTKDNRAQAIGGALITNAGYYTGLPNLVYTQAAWNFLIGDKLTEWQQGSNYSRYRSNRARNGYVPTWLQNATDSESIMDLLDKK